MLGVPATNGIFATQGKLYVSTPNNDGTTGTGSTSATLDVGATLKDLQSRVVELTQAILSAQADNAALQRRLQAAEARIRILERPGSYY